MSVLTIQDVSKQYGRFSALENINLQVEEGEFFAISGEEGSGKTTLAKLIMGMLRPKTGYISLFDRNIKTGIRNIKTSIGYVPEDILYYEGITAEDYLRQSMAFYRLDAGEELERLCSLFKLDIRQQLVSMTYQDNKMAAVVSALLHDPALILLDDPECVMSEEMELILLDELKRRCMRGVTIIWTCENVEYVKLICNKVAFIDKGKITKLVNMNEFQQEKVITLIGGETKKLGAAGARVIFQDEDRSVHTYKGDAETLARVIGDSGCKDYTVENASLYEQEFKYYERWHYLCR